MNVKIVMLCRRILTRVDASTHLTKKRRLLGWGLAPILVAACAVGPTYQKPDLAAQLPARYQHAKTTANSPAIERWWQIFNDHDMNQLVDTALSRNLTIASANAHIRQARAQLAIIDSATLPRLNASGRIGRDRISRNSEMLANLPLPNPEVNFTDYRAGLDASWELDLFGHNARRSEAARARLAIAEHQHDEVALRIAAEVARNVIDYRALNLRSKNAQAIIEASQQLLELSVLQQKAGLISENEVNAAKLALYQARAAIPPLEAAASATLLAITVLVDQSEEQVTAKLQTNLGVPITPDQIDFVGLPSDLLLRRPDLRRAERELAAATADIGVAVAEQYPKLSLIGNGGLDSIKPGKFIQLASTFWNLGPQVSIPIFAGGRLAAQVKNEEAARDAALADYRQAVLAALADTETALIRYQGEQQRLAHIKQAFESQHDQMKLAELRYQAGETDFVHVLQARQQLAQIHDQQLASQQLLAENLTGLFKALGGGWNVVG